MIPGSANATYSLDLFEQIYRVQEYAAQKMDDLHQDVFGFVRTVQNRMDGGTDATMRSLISKIDSLLDNLNEQFTSRFDTRRPKEAINIIKDIAGIGPMLSMSLPFFSSVRPKIPIIIGTFTSLMDGIDSAMKKIKLESAQKLSLSSSFLLLDFKRFAESVRDSNQIFDSISDAQIKGIGNKISLFLVAIGKQLETTDEKTIRKMQMITSLLSMDIMTFARNIRDSLPMMKFAQFLSGMLGRSLAATIKNLTKDINQEDVNTLDTLLNLDFLGFIKNYIFATPFILAFDKLSHIVIRSLSNILVGTMDMFTKTGITTDQVEAMANALNSMGSAILKFAISIGIAGGIMLLVDLVAEVLLGTLKQILDFFSKVKDYKDSVSDGAMVLIKVGFGILLFTGFIVGAAKLIGDISLASVAAMVGIIGGIVAFFNYVKIDQNSTFQNAKLLPMMALGLITMAIAIWSASMIMKNVSDFTPLIALFGIIVLTAGLYELLGRYGKNINEAALSVTLMALSMTMFGIALLTTAIATAAVGPENLLMVIGSMVLFSTLYFFVGKFWQNIALGALAVSTIAISLVIFGWGMQSVLASRLQDHPKFMWQFPLFLLGLGTVFALGGYVAPFLIAGAIGFALVGVALYALGWGIDRIPIDKLVGNPNFMWQFPLFLTGIGAVFAAAGLGALLIGAGALAMIAVGGALAVLGFGLSKIIDSGLTIEKATQIGGGIRILITQIGLSTQDLGFKDAALLPAKIALLVLLGGALIPFSFGVSALARIPGFGPNIGTYMGNLIRALYINLSSFKDTKFLVGLADAGKKFFIISGSLLALNLGVEKYNKHHKAFYNNINGIIKLSKPVDELSTSIKGLTEALKLQLDQFERSAAMANFSKYVDGLAKIEKADVAKLQANMSYIKENNMAAGQNMIGKLGDAMKDAFGMSKGKPQQGVPNNLPVTDIALHQKMDALIQLMTNMMSGQNANDGVASLEESLISAMSTIRSGLAIEIVSALRQSGMIK